jgi:imidazolonepropionase-like amidohydrolase
MAALAARLISVTGLFLLTEGLRSNVTLLHARLLIPGDGPPIADGHVVIDEFTGEIVYSGDGARMPPLPPHTPKLSVPVAMPGLFDTHTHFGGTSCPEIAADLETLAPGARDTQMLTFACALEMAREAICAGVTSVREVGNSFSQPLAHVLNGGLFPGPHFHYANFALGMTGGHADDQYLPINQVRNAYEPAFNGGGTALCDGPDECTKRTREQLRAQAGVIKVMATGGVLSAFDQPTDQELSLEEVSVSLCLCDTLHSGELRERTAPQSGVARGSV